MNSRIKKVLLTPPAPMPVEDEKCVDEAGGWRSRVSFLHGEDAFPHLANREHATDRISAFNQEIAGAKISRVAKRETALGVRNSCIARPDLRTEIEFPALSSKPYVSHYRMLHNGWVPGAVTSSLDRVTPKLTLARQMTATDPDGVERPICYSGRPDSLKKCVELAELIFQGEQRCGKAILQENGVYQLKFAINSSLSTTPGWPEHKLTKREYDILKEFNGTTVALRNLDGTLSHVKCEVIFFAKQFNVTNSLEKTLDPAMSGKEVSDQLSAKPAEIKKFLGEKASEPEIANLIEMLRHHALSPEQALFCRILLFKRAGIPLVLHCKSNVDRTSISVSMAYALDQWEKSGKSLPTLPYLVLQEEQFKELFFAHVRTGHWMTFYSRAGDAANKGFGFQWHVNASGSPLYFSQHPSMLALMPERLKTLNFTPLCQMALIPGGTILGARNIAKHFGTWISAKDHEGNKRIFMVFCRALALIPLLVKGLIETVLLALFSPSYVETLYKLSPEKIIPNSTLINGRPLLRTEAGA
ncbi:MAG TPA: hypothetical protein VLF94_02200 [Chlamydiales bacterium]|nr:hypothetical protein [Chlamydiales bacterium]